MKIDQYLDYELEQLGVLMTRIKFINYSGALLERERIEEFLNLINAMGYKLDKLPDEEIY